jgi:signal peptidase I
MSLRSEPPTTPIPLAPAPATPQAELNGTVPKPKDTVQVEVKETGREFLETIVFVFFLVLLLKAFVAEAFVIPTGSMAITLLGDHTPVICERCKHAYDINFQASVRPMPVECECPICQNRQRIEVPRAEGGDKVLVQKTQYDLTDPKRFDVIVFMFPGDVDYLPADRTLFENVTGRRRGGPQEDYGPRNFIKRLVGLPGEKLAIWYGDLYLVEKDAQGREVLKLARRPPDKMLAMRRIVFDNDYVNKNAKPPLVTRWRTDTDLAINVTREWLAEDDERTFTSPQDSTAFHWLRYRHLVQPIEPPNERVWANEAQIERPVLRRPEGPPPQPRLISDFLNYNPPFDQRSQHWVGDLMFEGEVEVVEPKGSVVLELNSGVDSCHARFDLATGNVQLRIMRNGQLLNLANASAATPLHRPGKHAVRFANFDKRLTLWVDGKLIFGDGVEFDPPADADRGPRVSDLYPVSIGARDAHVKVRKLQVWRDVYYIRQDRMDVPGAGNEAEAMSIPPAQGLQLIRAELVRAPKDLPDEWSAASWAANRILHKNWLRFYTKETEVDELAGGMPGPKFYPEVHPKFHPSDRFNADEYFALGDNSVQSKDSRYWGQVPKNLLLGKAVAIYWPWSRWRLIR